MRSPPTRTIRSTRSTTRDHVGPRRPGGAPRRAPSGPDAVRAFAALLVAYPPNGQADEAVAPRSGRTARAALSEHRERWSGRVLQCRPRRRDRSRSSTSRARPGPGSRPASSPARTSGTSAAPSCSPGRSATRRCCPSCGSLAAQGDRAPTADARAASGSRTRARRRSRRSAALPPIGELLALERTTRHGTLQRDDPQVDRRARGGAAAVALRAARARGRAARPRARRHHRPPALDRIGAAARRGHGGDARVRRRGRHDVASRSRRR